MNKYGLSFHHFGLAVRNPEKAIRWLAGLGYEIGPTVKDDLQQVNLVLCTSAALPCVEVVSRTEAEGPLASVLKSRTSLIYHVCYETQSLTGSLEAIARDNVGLIVASEAKPAILFTGRRVSFYQIDGFGLIEILEPE